MTATLTRAERETVAVWTEADDIVRITSTSPAQIRKLREHARFTEVQSDYADGLTAEFTIPAGDFTLTKGAKRPVSEDQRQALAGRLRKVEA